MYHQMMCAASLSFHTFSAAFSSAKHEREILSGHIFPVYSSKRDNIPRHYVMRTQQILQSFLLYFDYNNSKSVAGARGATYKIENLFVMLYSVT